MLTARLPIVDLRAFTNRNFAFGSLFSFVLGIGLYGLTYLYPVYLAQIRGYDALMIGDTMFVSGLAMFLGAPVAGQLGQRSIRASAAGRLRALCRRHLVDDLRHQGLGFLGAVLAADLPRRRPDARDRADPNVALGTLPPDLLKNASGLFNLMRNLGGAVGLAAINTVLNDQIDLHLARLHEAGDLVARARDRDPQQSGRRTGDPISKAAMHRSMALKQLTLIVHRQAVVMAFADVFPILGVLFVALAALGIIMRRPEPLAAAAASGH